MTGRGSRRSRRGPGLVIPCIGQVGGATSGGDVLSTQAQQFTLVQRGLQCQLDNPQQPAIRCLAAGVEQAGIFASLQAPMDAAGFEAAPPAMSISERRSSGKNAKALSEQGFFVWWRGWDSNPRWAINPRRFSRPLHSTALPPLRSDYGAEEYRNFPTRQPSFGLEWPLVWCLRSVMLGETFSRASGLR